MDLEREYTAGLGLTRSAGIAVCCRLLFKFMFRPCCCMGNTMAAAAADAEAVPEDELDLAVPFANELFASTGSTGVAFSLFCSRFIFCFLRGRGGDVLLLRVAAAVAAVTAAGPKLGSMKAVTFVGSGAAEDMLTATGAAVHVGLVLHVMICRGVTCATLGAVGPI